MLVVRAKQGPGDTFPSFTWCWSHTGVALEHSENVTDLG